MTRDDLVRPEPTLPSVSIVIPMRNERGYIGPCLESISETDYPPDRIEVIVSDGRSDDGSRDAVLAYTARGLNMRVIDNPGITPGAGINAALRLARGAVIVRMDAHALYPPDYVRRCVELLQATGAANVGGVRIPRGEGYLGNAIAIATHHPFGIGHGLLRPTGGDRWVDTVYLGAWRRQTLEAVGGFREDLPQNQDAELNHRLRLTGGRILWSPSIRYTYFVRPSVPALVRQYLNYGRGRVRTGVLHPGALRWRHYAPPVLVAVLLGSVALAALSPWALAVPGAYLAAVVAASLHACGVRRLRYLPAVAALFPVVHLAWGTGFWAGVLRHGIPNPFRPRRGPPTARGT